MSSQQSVGGGYDYQQPWKPGTPWPSLSAIAGNWLPRPPLRSLGWIEASNPNKFGQTLGQTHEAAPLPFFDLRLFIQHSCAVVSATRTTRTVRSSNATAGLSQFTIRKNVCVRAGRVCRQLVSRRRVLPVNCRQYKRTQSLLHDADECRPSREDLCPVWDAPICAVIF